MDCGVWDNHHENDVYELMFMLMNASQHLPILYMHQVVRTNELHKRREGQVFLVRGAASKLGRNSKQLFKEA